jgi:hypothetical protein
MTNAESTLSNPFRPRPEPLSLGLRALLVLLGGILLAMLALAAWLSPNPRGLGTHHQLGLPPCTLRVMAGMRCPSCGMTTSWAYLVRGRIVPAFAANSGGALLGILAITLGPWMLVSGWRGQWWGGFPNEWSFAICSIGIMMVTLFDWGLRIYFGQN